MGDDMAALLAAPPIMDPSSFPPPPRLTNGAWHRGHVLRPRSSPTMLRWLQLLHPWTLSAAPISLPLAMQMLVRINLDPPTPEKSSVFLRDREVVAQNGTI